MGIYLGLRVLPDEIGAVEWERFYDAAKQVIQAFKPQPVRLTEEEKFGFTRLVLTRSPEGQDHKGRFLAVVGDAQTWGCAEQFHIYRDIGVYREMQKRRAAPAALSRNARHILLREEEGVDVFFAKTQSHPYHDLVWCLATLAENEFAGLALARGDLNARNWLTVHAWLRQVSGRPLVPPLLLDVQRLWDILGTELDGIDLARAVSERMVDKAPLYRLLRDKDPDLLGKFLAESLREYPAHTMGALRTCMDFLDSVGDLALLVKVASVDPAGPRWEVDEVLRIVVALGAFTPQGRAQESGLAAGFLPAEFRPDFYCTNFYVQPEEAARQVAGIIGRPVIDIEEIIFRIQREEAARMISGQVRGGKTGRNAGEKLPLEEAKVEIPYPEQLISGLREEMIRKGFSWDETHLRRLMLAMMAKAGIMLPEEAWAALDSETDPDILGFLPFLLHGYQGSAAEREMLCHLFANLGEIKQCWKSGRPWIYNVD
jgi:hypothetical protein